MTAGTLTLEGESMHPETIGRHWRRIFDTMSEGLMVIGVDGRIVMVNPSFETMTGYSADEVRGEPCTLLECDACERALSNTGDQWCKLFQPGHQGLNRCRCALLRKDGTYLTVLKNASVLYDDDGRVLGAVETLTDISEIDRLDQEVALLSRQLDSAHEYQGIIGASPAMLRVFDVIEKAARSEAPVIIYGESGTGKELVARAIHARGRRRNGPFVQFNCAALNDSLLESELFGHTKGAFTGAYRHRIGRFEAAHTGDIFLDEIGDIPLPLQAKLLRVLETKVFERVGDHRPIHSDVRIISATNRDLPERVRNRKFREDLFFRINVIPIHLPPLRQRKEDIPLLISRYIRLLNRENRRTVTGLSPAAMRCCMQYAWPGNVRELKSMLEYAFVVSGGEVVQPEHLPPVMTAAPVPVSDEPMPSAMAPEDPPEKIALVQALKETGGNQTRAAQLLGINRVTVWNRMRKYNIVLGKDVTCG